MSDRRVAPLVLLCSAQGLVVFDQAVIGLVLPGLPADLGVGAATLPWVMNAYVIALGGLSLLGGRLADLYGARRTFALGIVGLIVGAGGAALAPSAAALIGARALQGAAAAVATPAALALLRTMYGARPEALRAALAAWGAAAAIGGVVGLVVGGIAIDGLGWRWALASAAPIGALALAATPALLPPSPRAAGRLDVVGALAATAGIALVVAAIVGRRGPGVGVGPTIALGALGAAALAGFVARQRGPAPLVPLVLVRCAGVVVGNLSVAVLGAAYVPLWFFLSVHVHGGLGWHGLDGAVALLPMRLVLMVLSLLATRRLMARFGVRATLVAGLIALAASLALFARVGDAAVVGALASSVLGAIGMALAYVPAMTIATRGAPPSLGGVAGGLVGTSYQLGSALGLAITAAAAEAAGVAAGAFTAAGFAVAGVAIVRVGARDPMAPARVPAATATCPR